LNTLIGAWPKVSDIELKSEVPGADEYCALRVAAGLSSKTPIAARLGLPGTLFAIIGMGRVIGDGGCNYEIVDVAVHPDYQRQGYGFRIMEALMEYIHDHAPESAYVSLIADHGAPALYEKFGFEFTAPTSVAMAKRI
jgi:ribosomal protein S18 acetylase RimI-like enzyme